MSELELVAEVDEAPPPPLVDPATGRREGGQALLELVIALTLLLAVLVPTAEVVQSAFAAGGGSRMRMEAAGVAATQLDQLQTEPFSSIALGRTVTQATVGSSRFTVAQDVELVGARSSTSGCATNGSGQSVLRASIQVSWPGGAGPLSVTETTTFSPPVDAFSPSDGTVSATVVGAANQPVAGVAVTIDTTPAVTEQTTSTGCAMFTDVTPGSYSVSLSASGDVSDQELVTPSQSVQVTAGGSASLQFLYDRAAEIAVTWAVPGNGSPATGLPLAVGNALLQPSGWYAASPGSNSSGPVFPYANGYTLWAGNCEESDPQGVGTTGQPIYPGAPVLTPVAVSPGSVSSATVTLSAVTVKVVTASKGTPVSGAALTATADGTGCPTTSYTMVSTGSAGTSVTGLPYGHFSIGATAGSTSGSTTVWVTPSGILAEPAGTPISGPVVVSVK